MSLSFTYLTSSSCAFVCYFVFIRLHHSQAAAKKSANSGMDIIRPVHICTFFSVILGVWLVLLLYNAARLSPPLSVLLTASDKPTNPPEGPHRLLEWWPRFISSVMTEAKTWDLLLVAVRSVCLCLLTAELEVSDGTRQGYCMPQCKSGCIDAPYASFLECRSDIYQRVGPQYAIYYTATSSSIAMLP